MENLDNRKLQEIMQKHGLIHSGTQKINLDLMKQRIHWEQEYFYNKLHDQSTELAEKRIKMLDVRLKGRGIYVAKLKTD
jgi:hypothetical protein